MTPSDNVVVLAAIREVRKAERIRRAVTAQHPSTRFARFESSPASSVAGGESAAALSTETATEQETQ